MDLDASPLASEIDKIISDDNQQVNNSWDVEFRIREPNPIVLSTAENDVNFTDEKEKEKVYKPLKLLNIDFVRDYELNSAEEITLRCAIPLGLWFKVLFQYRDYLEVTLIKTPLHQLVDSTDQDANVETEVYACVPKIDSSTSGEGKTIEQYSRFELDLKGFVEVDFQLFDLSTECLRKVTVGGIWRRTTGMDTVKAILSNESAKYKVKEDPAIEKLNFVEADNKEKREHVMIPHTVSLPLSAVARYVQSTCGGIYNTGINQFLQDKAWWVYPLYDTTRFDQEENTLTIFRVPQYRYNNIERTYRVDGDRLYVLATSNTEFKDTTNVRYLNEGNGVRFADARRYFADDLVEAKDNKAVAHRNKLVHEFVSEEVPAGNNVYVSKDAVNANPFVEYSKLARRKGSIYMFAWENCNLSLVRPGMMVKIVYIKGDEIVELQGCLLKVHLSVALDGMAITATTYKNIAALAVFVNFEQEQ